MGKIKLPNGVRVFENKEMFPGKVATCWQFKLDDVERTRQIINELNKFCVFDKIESEQSRADALKHAKWLIENKNYTFYNSSDEDAVRFEDLPEEQKKGVYGFSGYEKVKPWTPEMILEKDGWYEDEVYWFHMTKNRDYSYQLILKDGDWIAFAPCLGEGAFFNAGPDCRLPYKSDWKEKYVS